MGNGESSANSAAASDGQHAVAAAIGGFRREADPRLKKRVQRAAPQLDVYMQHAQVTDHITPIYDGSLRKQRGDDDDDEGDVDVRQVLREVGLGGGLRDDRNADDDADALDNLEVSSESDSDGDSADGDEVGMFHKDVQKIEAAKLSIFDPEAHPLQVRGLAQIGEKLTLHDLSPWKMQFPLHSIDWHASSAINEQHKFQPEPLGSSSKSLVVTQDLLGRYVQVRATRRVESQIRDTRAAEVEGGVYDPHVVGKATHARRGIEVHMVDVQSTYVVGPVVISDSWAMTLLKSLADGRFQLAVNLMDRLERPDTDSPTRTGKSGKKIPAFIDLDAETLVINYVVSSKLAAESVNTGGLRIFSWEWLQYVLGFNVKTADDAEKVGKMVAAFPLRKIFVRPAENSKYLILAVKRKDGKVGAAQELIRLSIDPVIGSILALCHVIAFQGAAKVRRADWQALLKKGELALVKDFLQQRLEDLATTIDPSAPAFEVMPLTPWEP